MLSIIMYRINLRCGPGPLRSWCERRPLPPIVQFISLLYPTLSTERGRSLSHPTLSTRGGGDRRSGDAVRPSGCTCIAYLLAAGRYSDLCRCWDGSARTPPTWTAVQVLNVLGSHPARSCVTTRLLLALLAT